MADKAEMEAMNSGFLNDLKIRRDGAWAWPPMSVDNPIDKIEEMLAAMENAGRSIASPDEARAIMCL